MMKLYYVPNASSLAAHIALEWVKADYEAIPANFGDEILRELNPIGTAGILDCGNGYILTQLPAILIYLARMHPDADIGDQNQDLTAAEIDRWSSFLVSDVHHVFHLLFFPGRYGIEDNADAREAALQLCYRNFKIIDDHLKERHYMLGDRKSILDAYLLPMIRWTYVQFPDDRRNFEHVNAFHDEMLTDPSVIAAMEQEGIWDTIRR